MDDTRIRVYIENCAQIDTFHNYEALIAEVQRAEAEMLRKKSADEFLNKSDRWMTKMCRQAMRVFKPKLADFDDLKHDMIVQVYKLASKYDASRNVAFNVYIVSQLRYFFYSTHIEKTYGNPSNMYRMFCDRYAEDAEYDDIEDTCREISSLEKAHGVFSHIEFLSDAEKVLVHLRFEIGLEYKQIENMLGTSHGAIWHQMQTILRKIQTRVSQQWPDHPERR